MYSIASLKLGIEILGLNILGCKWYINNKITKEAITTHSLSVLFCVQPLFSNRLLNQLIIMAGLYKARLS